MLLLTRFCDSEGMDVSFVSEGVYRERATCLSTSAALRSSTISGWTLWWVLDLFTWQDDDFERVVPLAGIVGKGMRLANRNFTTPDGADVRQDLNVCERVLGRLLLAAGLVHGVSACTHR